MKNVKRVVILVFVMAFLWAVTACKPKDVSGDVTKPGVEGGSEENISMGEYAGGKYENKYFGVGCDLGDGWTYASRDELLTLAGIVSDQVGSEDFSKQLEKTGVFYDMMAQNLNEGSNINVTVENIGTVYGVLLDEKQIVENNLKALPDTMKSAGMEVSEIEAVELDFAGQKHHGIHMKSTIAAEGVEVEVYQTLVMIKKGAYLMNCTATSYGTDTSGEMLKSFYVIEK